MEFSGKEEKILIYSCKNSWVNRVPIFSPGGGHIVGSIPTPAISTFRLKVHLQQYQDLGVVCSRVQRLPNEHTNERFNRIKNL